MTPRDLTRCTSREIGARGATISPTEGVIDEVAGREAEGLEGDGGVRRPELVGAVEGEAEGGAGRRRRRGEAVGDDLAELGEGAGVGDVELEGLLGFQRSEPELHDDDDDRPQRCFILSVREREEESRFPCLKRKKKTHRLSGPLHVSGPITIRIGSKLRH